MNEEEKYKRALFLILRNNRVLPLGLKLGKSMSEINEMTYETMENIVDAINHEQVEKDIAEGMKLYEGRKRS